MALVHVIVTNPYTRTVSWFNLPGFWSGGLYWPPGVTELDLDSAVVAAMEGEITRSESILTIQRVPGATTAPAPGRLHTLASTDNPHRND